MAELVFVGGSWRKISMPIDVPWTLEYRQLFACAVVGFERQGFCEAEALRLAECLVYKLIHKGLKYDKKTELIIEGLWGIA
jgi:hypothetical protein